MAADRGRQRNRGGRKPTAKKQSGGIAQWLSGAAAVVLDAGQPAGHALKDFFAANRQIGSRDRRLIADRCYYLLRNKRLLAWRATRAATNGDDPAVLIRQADAAMNRQLIGPDEGGLPADLGDSGEAELTAAVRFSLPDWLASDLQSMLGDDSFARLAAALLTPPGLDLRVNPQFASRSALSQALSDADIETVIPDPATALCPDGLLRVVGHPAVEQSSLFKRGAFEVQDAGSQFLVQLAGPKRNQTVVDFCAGAGGKSLAMAAIMRDSGNVYACDTSQRRLSRLTPRLTRAGLRTVRPMAIESENDGRLARLAGKADLVFVDAPCSGIGTLRRNPELKWRVSEDEIAGHADRQLRILQAAARLVAPGGRLFFATCSLLARENEHVGLAFEASGDNFERIDLGGQSRLHDMEQEPSAPEYAGYLRIWPHIHDCDGYFAAAWKRK